LFDVDLKNRESDGDQLQGEVKPINQPQDRLLKFQPFDEINDGNSDRISEENYGKYISKIRCSRRQ